MTVVEKNMKKNVYKENEFCSVPSMMGIPSIPNSLISAFPTATLWVEEV